MRMLPPQKHRNLQNMIIQWKTFKEHERDALLRSGGFLDKVLEHGGKLLILEMSRDSMENLGKTL